VWSVEVAEVAVALGSGGQVSLGGVEAAFGDYYVPAGRVMVDRDDADLRVVRPVVHEL